MADGWLEDNRYGTFADIVERTDAPLMKGDMILTTIKIERDDAGLGNIWNNGRVQGMMRGTMTAEEEKGTVPTMPISPTGELSRLTW